MTLANFFHDPEEFEDAWHCAVKLAPSREDMDWLHELNQRYKADGMDTPFAQHQYAKICRLAGA